MAGGGVTRIPRPEDVDARKKERLQPYVDQYTYHVVIKLIGVKGIDKQEVAAQLLREWINDHWAQLEKWGIQPPMVRDNGIVLNSDEKAG